jgi:EmrB/QacA subfamily drug resistance transporter
MRSAGASRASHGKGHDRQHPTLTLGVLSLSAAAYILLQSMVLPALPEIGRALHTSQSTVAWVLTAYLISASVATPVLGRLGDMFGKKRVLLIVLAALIAGSVLAALATSVPVMLAARVIQGAGGAIFPLAFSIVRDEFPRERVAGAIGMISALIGVGAGVAIVVAGPIVENLSIHWLFWIPAIMTAVALVATVFWVPESPITAPGRINAPAVLTLSGWLVCLLLGVSEGGEWGWWSLRVLGLFAGSIVLFVAWLMTELRAEEPLVDVRMMRVPSVWWTNISATLFGFGMYSVMIAVPAFLQTPSSAGYGFGASITRSGLALLPLSAAMLVAGVLTGAFATRYGSKVPLVVGSALSAFGMLFLTVAHGSEWNFYVALAFVGLGIGFAFSAMSNLVVEAVPPGQTGVATGMNANVRTIGGAVGSQVVASIIAAGIVGHALPKESGYEISFIVLAVALALAGLAAAFVPSRAERKIATDGHEFDTLTVDGAIAPAEAGLAIGEHMHDR